MKPLILPTILMLGWVIHHNTKQKKGSDKDHIASFLARESAANSTRRADISNLPYVTIPMDIFPFDITLKDEKKQSKIADYKKELTLLSTKKMLNLIGVSNTELKEQYGPANLQTLINCDQYYSRYLRTCHQFAECIYEDAPEQAIAILEHCLFVGTDITKTYELLGKHYKSHGQEEAFSHLFDCIPDKESIAGKLIQNKLNAL